MDSILSFDRSREKNYYDVLGCDQSSSVEQMMAEYKNRALALHPDKNKERDAAYHFQLLQEARETLTNPSNKAHYDKWLRSGVNLPYKRWKDMAKGASFHWSTPPKPERMLIENETGEYPPINQEIGDSGQGGWRRDSSDLIKKFRNYEI